MTFLLEVEPVAAPDDISIMPDCFDADHDHARDLSRQEGLPIEVVQQMAVRLDPP
jgi:hypothetical protein